jgi:hypothetical protein
LQRKPWSANDAVDFQMALVVSPDEWRDDRMRIYWTSAAEFSELTCLGHCIADAQMKASTGYGTD